MTFPSKKILHRASGVALLWFVPVFGCTTEIQTTTVRAPAAAENGQGSPESTQTSSVKSNQASGAQAITAPVLTSVKLLNMVNAADRAASLEVLNSLEASGHIPAKTKFAFAAAQDVCASIAESRYKAEPPKSDSEFLKVDGA